MLFLHREPRLVYTHVTQRPPPPVLAPVAATPPPLEKGERDTVIVHAPINTLEALPLTG